MITVALWWQFVAALFIGALIGLEREFMQQREGEPAAAGLRTYAFVSLLGAVGAYLSLLVDLPLVFGLTFAGVILLVIAEYILDRIGNGHGKPGITSEITLLVAFLLGSMVVWGQIALAVFLAVSVTVLLSLKSRLHRIVRAMSYEDLRMALQFALISGVILPILPNDNYGPFALLNPYSIWLLVVMVSGVGFVGYVLIKVLGAERGIGLMGILGGLVSSTATTVSMASASQSNPKYAIAYAQGILLASSVMFGRILVLIGLSNSTFVRPILGPFVAMLLVGLVIVVFMAPRKQEPHAESATLAINNPLKMSTALTFALIYTLVVVGIKLVDQQFGNQGIYIASLITGLIDADAIALGISQLVAAGQIPANVGAGAVVLAAVMNSLSKGAIAFALGHADLRRPVLLALMSMALVGGIVTWVVV